MMNPANIVAYDHLHHILRKKKTKPAAKHPPLILGSSQYSTSLAIFPSVFDTAKKYNIFQKMPRTTCKKEWPTFLAEPCWSRLPAQVHTRSECSPMLPQFAVTRASQRTRHAEVRRTHPARSLPACISGCPDIVFESLSRIGKVLLANREAQPSQSPGHAVTQERSGFTEPLLAIQYNCPQAVVQICQKLHQS